MENVKILPISVAAELTAQDTSTKIPSGYAMIDDCMDGGFREGDFTIFPVFLEMVKQLGAAASP